MLGSWTSSPLSGRTDVRRISALVIALIMSIGLAIGSVFHGLLATMERATAQSVAADEVVHGLLEIDGIEWRAIAGEPLDEVLGAFEDRSVELRAAAAQAGAEGSNELVAQTEVYLDAVEAEFAAIGAGDLALAREIDEARVDPAFELVEETASGVSEGRTAMADRSSTNAERVAWVSVMSCAIALSVGVAMLLRRRDRQTLVAHEESSARRFRSLVESSADVITVVSGAGDLHVMSPSLGFLHAVASTDFPASMGELLPAAQLEQWAEFDALVVSGQAVESMGMAFVRPDGSVLDVEAIGRPLTGEPGHRVWVWRDISERKTLETELTRRAFHDALTGLANRSLLHDRAHHAVARAERTAEPVAMLLCDLDNFKTINDALGHHRGDELLVAVTTRMAGCLRAGDTLARLGGDEFAVLLENAEEWQAVEIAERLLAAVSQQLCLDDHELFPSLSIGIALHDHEITVDELLRRADVAMYEAKRGGKGRSEVYRPGLIHVTDEALLLQGELRKTVLDGGLSLAFQPTVSLTDGSVTSVEALVRWHHPTLGSIPPVKFIPMAEESGLIVTLGRWVLQEACRAAVTLSGTDGTGITMHVNISPAQLNDPTIVAFVKETLAETGLDPRLLVLEVTEGTLLSNAAAIDRLVELHGHGVRLAVDDFGTGYASITYLRRLPIDILKIDRAFVSGDGLEPKERRALLETIVALANSLDLTSVAEGVETEAERLEVASIGCDRGQGYFWARPVDLETLQTTIRDLGVAASSVA